MSRFGSSPIPPSSKPCPPPPPVMKLSENERQEFESIKRKLKAAERDIAAILWISGKCEYCKYRIVEEYMGATLYSCSLGGLDCKPEWRGCEGIDR